MAVNLIPVPSCYQTYAITTTLHLQQVEKVEKLAQQKASFQDFDIFRFVRFFPSISVLVGQHSSTVLE